MLRSSTATELIGRDRWSTDESTCTTARAPAWAGALADSAQRNPDTPSDADQALRGHWVSSPNERKPVDVTGACERVGPARSAGCCCPPWARRLPVATSPP